MESTLGGNHPTMRRYQRRSNWVGRTRRQAANLLTDHFGVSVDTGDFLLVYGYWRKADVYRWEVGVRSKGHEDSGTWYGCWQTMTEFVRLAKKYGISVNEKDTEIEANEGPTPQ
jgi:hypothetical protein